MNSKERMLAALDGRQPDAVPVAPHWWGNYKFEVAGKDYMLDCWTDGQDMVPTYRAFFERFEPDWFHLSGGYPRRRGPYRSRDYRGVREGERMYLVAPDGSRDEILADGNLASQKHDAALRRDLSTPAAVIRAIDEDLARDYRTMAEDIIAAGYTDHAAEIVREYGDSVFICVNVGAPGILAFGSGHYRESLMALHDYPEGVKRLAWRRYQAALEWAKAFAGVGVHGWLISEDVAGSDTISPRMYEEMLYPVDCWFFEQVSRLGMVPMVYFCGDVRPLIPLLKDSGARALLIEDSRKSFVLDVVEIAKGLEGRVCLFGNVDTTELLLRGRPEEVEAAVRSQLEAARYGPFVVANGSPLAPGTPPENVEAMIGAARRYGRYPLT
ncbi:MAG: uroporphyrinogen decarboxylase family protein [Anaerolineae bacterium]|nr:uroporphyrinogen decarboxylase family protein [Anaerolineae bacterium]